jgi:hypothetical protein
MFTKFLQSGKLKSLVLGGIMIGNSYLLGKLFRKKYLKCCGIIGFIGKKPNASKVILNGVELL